jgi:hypothetical protein
MNRSFLLAATISMMTIAACNNSDEHANHDAAKNTEPASQADSLFKEVMHGHDEAMAAQMTKMEKAKASIQQMIDSIGKLPAKAKEEAAPYKEKLNQVLQDLNDAGNKMNIWMVEFNMDSAKDNIEQRIKYLSDEKLKVNDVKDAIFNSIEKADSLIKQKF